MIDLENLIENANRLEPMSASVSRLISLIADEEHDTGAIVEVISLDQLLTANLLRYANSADSGSRIPITTVKDAVVRLGYKTVFNVAITAGVRGRLKQSVPQYGLEDDDLWQHSVAAALAADCINRYSLANLPPESYTAALLHDIGKLVLGRYLGSDDLYFLKCASTNGGLDPAQAELEILDVNHGELGGIIAQHWNFPDRIIRGITYHHNPDEGNDPICYAVYLANQIAHRVNGRVDCMTGVPVFPEQPLKAAGLTPESYEQICLHVQKQLDAVVNRFN